MEAQMRQAWANVDKVLAQYGATIDNIVDEVLFVTDTEAALAAAVKIRPEVFRRRPAVASTTAAICAGRRPVFGRLSGTTSSKLPSHVQS
jgi:2-iminobutanoate/2-iminopropanoate deaminase